MFEWNVHITFTEDGVQQSTNVKVEDCEMPCVAKRRARSLFTEEHPEAVIDHVEAT